MNEHKLDKIRSVRGITFSEYADLAASSAQYMEAADPELVLRSGLIEEAAEVLDTDPTDSDEFQKEIGDIIWYLSQIAHYKGLSLEQVVNIYDDEFTTFGEFQTAQTDTPTLPGIYSAEEAVFEPEDSPREFLAMGILRVIDVLNPKMDELWQNKDRPDLSVILHEALSILAKIGNTCGISIENAAGLTLDKIKNRPRNPHVIDNQESLIASLRERIAVDPRVRRLLGTAALKGNYTPADRESL